MRGLWGKKATVKGTVYFKPSGTARFIDADVIAPAGGGDGIFAQVPVVRQSEMQFAEHASRIVPAPGLAAELWGKWPGDEPIEILLADLRG